MVFSGRCLSSSRSSLAVQLTLVVVLVDVTPRSQAGHQCFWSVEYEVKAQLVRSGSNEKSRRRASDSSTVPINVLSASPRPFIHSPTSTKASSALTTVAMRKCYCYSRGRSVTPLGMTSLTLSKGRGCTMVNGIF